MLCSFASKEKNYILWIFLSTSSFRFTTDLINIENVNNCENHLDIHTLEDMLTWGIRRLSDGYPRIVDGHLLRKACILGIWKCSSCALANVSLQKKNKQNLIRFWLLMLAASPVGNFQWIFFKFHCIIWWFAYSFDLYIFSSFCHYLLCNRDLYDLLRNKLYWYM